MLLSYTLRSSSSSSSLNLAPIENQVLFRSCYLRLSTKFPRGSNIPDRPQPFYLLACSNCSQFVRPKTKKWFDASTVS
ncbi:hypothetical protein P3S68_033823 [Capsicum galapagoense]